MKPVIKQIISSDIDDLAAYKPESADNFEVAISIDIGLEGKEGADIFQVSVVTPKWIVNVLKKERVFVPRFNLIVSTYDYDSIIKKLDEICKQCSGKDWDECSLRLSKYFMWEYEDYKENL